MAERSPGIGAVEEPQALEFRHHFGREGGEAAGQIGRADDEAVAGPGLELLGQLPRDLDPAADQLGHPHARRPGPAKTVERCDGSAELAELFPNRSRPIFRQIATDTIRRKPNVFCLASRLPSASSGIMP